jgi:hypothetical protein
MSNLSQFLPPAPALMTTTTSVSLAATVAPTTGQVLTATSPTTAAWTTPVVSGGGEAFSAF